MYDFFKQIDTNTQDTDTKNMELQRAGRVDQHQIAPHLSEEALINTHMQQ